MTTMNNPRSNGEVKCLAFVEVGQAVPARCDKTQDMFEGN